MPAIHPPSKVLVSGANGFVATWVIRNLLEHGYSVRGTVRSARKGEHLKKYFAGYGDKLEIVIVEDITKEGAFDKAVKCVDAIVHMASPISDHFNHSDDIMPDDLLLTVNHPCSQSIKRVVFTSSGATIMQESDTPVVLTEKDWNIECLEMFKELGGNAPDSVKYRASKVFAEQGAWKFMQEHEIGWDLTVLNPTYVFGPVIHEVTDPSSLNLTPGLFYRYVANPVKSEEADNEFLAKTGSAWTDVRDLADAHRLALEIEEAKNERIIISAGGKISVSASIPAQIGADGDIAEVDIANALDPPPNLSNPLPRGNTGASSQATVDLYLDNTKSKRVLGLKYRSMAEMTKDTLADYEARGW
ncbi:hypothetical protein SCLCIDRAFT_25022 [Scleroderma citrinum Foug A]|uniref:NAD-dependent epimerase/dehydratase domain-containing protein n=1 Tax=Scleroderma citrinum Foug A TaxID=1036808 RepID=A0A0C3AC90_9AGAM|nr:hypothetical protein SCLCIDRAFT_25022 [Scleroderma citrinum Foug A]